MDTPALDLDSTLIRRGLHATTFTEMNAFVDTIERRPLDKLLLDLPGFALLSETKFNLARQVLRRRMRDLDAVDREQLRSLAHEVAAGAGEALAVRIRGLF